MDIQIHYRDLHRSPALDDTVRDTVSRLLSRFAPRLTRVEVHLGDENSAKGGRDKTCVVEARPAGEKPVAASFLATDPYRAARGAVAKLNRVLARRFERR